MTPDNPAAEVTPEVRAANDATWALWNSRIWESPDGRSIPALLAAIGQTLARLADQADLRAALGDADGGEGR